MTTPPIRLGSNENLLGPSPVALETIARHAHEYHVYATTEDWELMEKLAAHIGGGLTADQFVIGNGSGDVLRMMMQTFVLPEDEVIFPLPTFAAYKRLTNVHRGKMVTVPLKGYQVDLEGILTAVTPNTRLIILCNPNNPTGLIVTHDELERFLKALPPHVTVILDEAYHDFVELPGFPRTPELIAAGYNVMATRTFSKLYGLAGLRVGYGFGKQALVEQVRNSRHLSETGRVAYLAAMAALTDEAHVVETLAMVRNGRRYLTAELSKLGLPTLPSEAFYILMPELPIGAQQLVDEARQRGVILRHTDVFDMPGSVRISIGRQQDNERAIAVLKEILSNSGEIKPKRRLGGLKSVILHMSEDFNEPLDFEGLDDDLEEESKSS